MDLFHKVQKSDQLPKGLSSGTPSKDKNKTELRTVEACCFSFEALNEVIRFAHVAKGFVLCQNSLYKDKACGHYHLVIYNRNIGVREFNQLSNAASEYGQVLKSTANPEGYYNEHFETIIRDHALQSLAAV